MILEVKKVNKMYRHDDYIIDYGRFIKPYSTIYCDVEEFFVVLRDMLSIAFQRKILSLPKVLEIAFGIGIIFTDIQFDMELDDFLSFKSDLSEFLNYILSELVKNEMFEQASNISKIKDNICF